MVLENLGKQIPPAGTKIKRAPRSTTVCDKDPFVNLAESTRMFWQDKLLGVEGMYEIVSRS
jgi:hypothetical protein